MSKVSKQFLIYTFMIMGICWGTCMICSLNGLSLKRDYILYIPYMLGGWSPTIASYIVLKKNGRVNNFKEWLKNVFDFKHGLKAYLLVVVLAVLYVLPQCIVSGYEKGEPIYIMFLAIPLMLLGGGLEEAGWRYILQPELEEKCHYLVATIIVALIWWLWHFPLFHISGVGQEGQNYLAFGFGVFGMSFALACVRKSTKSVGLCVLLHCMVNASGASFKINDTIVGNAVMAAVMIIITLPIVYTNKEKQC